MFLRSFFSERLKQLRKTHFLTNNSLAFLLNLKNEASIRDYEARRTIPSADVLSDVSNLFGVSIDWLAGHSDTPYINEILLRLEDEHIERILATQKAKTPDFALAYIKDNPYLKQDDREKHFSLPVRANIVFLFAKLRLETEKFIAFDNPINAVWNNFHEFKTHVLPPLLDGYQFFKKARNDNAKQLNQSFTQLERLIVTREVNEPIFDITKPPLSNK